MGSAKTDDKNRVRVASGIARRYAAEARSVVEKLTQRSSSINELEPDDEGADAASTTEVDSNRKI